MFAAKEMKNLVNLIKLSPPDLMVVSLEGMKFPTWRLLLAMHSPLLASLLQTLRPGEEGLLAITLPLPYTSVSSMLATLGEGGNLDHLAEAAQMLAFGNNMMSASSAPSPVTMRKRNAKQVEEEMLKNRSSLDSVVGVDQQLTGVNHMLSTSFSPTKVSRNGRNPGNFQNFQQTREAEEGGGSTNHHGEAAPMPGNNSFVATKDSSKKVRNPANLGKERRKIAEHP